MTGVAFSPISTSAALTLTTTSPPFFRVASVVVIVAAALGCDRLSFSVSCRNSHSAKTDEAISAADRREMSEARSRIKVISEVVGICDGEGCFDAKYDVASSSVEDVSLHRGLVSYSFAPVWEMAYASILDSVSVSSE